MMAQLKTDLPLLSLSHSSLNDANPLALLVTDEAHTIRYANASAELLLNTSAAFMDGKPLSSILKLDEAWNALLAQTRTFHRGVKGHDLSLETVKQAAEPLRVNAHFVMCQPFKDSEEQGILMVLEASTVSDKLGSHATQRDTMRSAAVMGHILAHEVRNPLSGIKSAAQLLRGSVETEDDKELLTLICREVDRIGNLMGQVEYFSTDIAIDTAPVNIHEVMRYVVDLTKNGLAAGITLQENYDPSLPDVRGNHALLVQALLNLVKNAAEAVEGREGARILLKTSYRSGYRISLAEGGAPVALPICVTVEDNGSGIDAALRANIFDPFVTSKSHGKGLGLAVVAKIIADHGGVIALEAAESGNTRFVIQLPAWTEKA
ncbi:MAG: two-component sensor histidine kinase [Alphaproteobacteria bacterium]|nr:two-component sensor histidine kinase [Alphaproteobacteria bacterium]